MTSGGKRPGAGAPAHNLNSLKNGEFSSQLWKAFSSSDPGDWKVFLARLKNPKFRARANMVATLKWIHSFS